jgi:hypothetical protein
VITPLSTYEAAAQYCKARNEGKNHYEAWEIALQYGMTREDYERHFEEIARNERAKKKVNKKCP